MPSGISGQAAGVATASEFGMPIGIMDSMAPPERFRQWPARSCRALFPRQAQSLTLEEQRAWWRAPCCFQFRSRYSPKKIFLMTKRLKPTRS